MEGILGICGIQVRLLFWELLGFVILTFLLFPGWAYGKVSPIDPTTLNPSRKAEIESMGANFWVRYDDGFYPQKLERKAYLKEGIFADDVEVGTWCIVERFKKKRKRKKD